MERETKNTMWHVKVKTQEDIHFVFQLYGETAMAATNNMTVLTLIPI